MNIVSTFSNLLPPPTYITLPSVGVDISDTSIKYIAFEPTLRSRKERVLKIWGDINIPANSLNRGAVVNVKQLAEVLKEFKKVTQADFIRVSLPEERAYIFETEIKNDVPSKEIASLLEFRLEENVPIAARDTIFDYDFLPMTAKQNSSRVVVAAYQRDVVMEYYEACLSAELTPVAFEVEAQAMARSVIPQAAANDTIMLVDFGKTRSGVGIVKNGLLLYTSTIDIGGDQISQMLRRVLGENVAEATLTDLKNNQGLIRGITDTKIYDALIPTVSVIKDEIATRMQYWHTRENNRTNDRHISKIILCGGSSNLKGLPEYLTESLGATCTRGNVWENVFVMKDAVPPIEKHLSYGYATAIGLALGKTI